MLVINDKTAVYPLC